MEMNYNPIYLKFAWCFGKRAQTQIIVDPLLENALDYDIFFLVFYKHFVYDKGT